MDLTFPDGTTEPLPVAWASVHLGAETKEGLSFFPSRLSLWKSGQRQRAFDLALHQRSLATTYVPRSPIHLILDVFVEFGNSNEPVTVAVCLSAKAFEDMIGEEPMS